MSVRENSVRNAFTVDVEDYFHAEALSGCVARDSWNEIESRVVNNTRRVLELMSRHQTRGTFFVLGWVAEKFPCLVKEIARAGHELGCHSFYHRLVYNLTPDEFRVDTRRAKQAIEQAAGQAVIGYRAPTFSITRRSLWALNILAEEGFRYDSSIFPIRHDYYGIPDYSRFACEVDGLPLTEFPVSTFRYVGRNWPFGGGGYLRMLPMAYTRYGFRAVNKGEGRPVVAYVHPWEFDPEQPRLRPGFRSRLRHYTNLEQMEARTAELLGNYAFGPLGSLMTDSRSVPGAAPIPQQSLASRP